MRTSLRTCAMLACLACTIFRGQSLSRAANPDPDSSPAKLVRAALEAELAGDSAKREQLLTEALVLDPNFAPARWHSSFVKIDDQWVKIDDVPKRTTGDPTLSAYRKLRDSLVDTADNHRQLARWCKKHKLPDQARVHWLKVLEFNPQDPEAIAALDLELFEGRLMTRSQIFQARLEATQRAKALRTWQPELLKWRRVIESGEDFERKVALSALEQIDDPLAVDVLEKVFAVDGAGDKIIHLNRALVQTVGRFPTQEATQVLLRRALVGEPEQVRDLAIAELKKREPSSYVPQLIALSPRNQFVRMEHRFSIIQAPLPNGQSLEFGIVREYDVYFRDLDTGKLHCIRYTDENLRHPMNRTPAQLRIEGNLAQHKHIVMNLRQQIEAMMQNSQFLQERIERVAIGAAGFNKGTSRAEMWTTLNQYYESYAEPQYRPEFGPEIVQFTSRRYAIASCFPQGTPIQTQSGLVAIETIKPGDLVLSQDIATGELTFKPVQAVTLRPPAPLAEIESGGETIRATRGHPFWVNGKGWRMAKQLTVGDKLHALDGPMVIHRVAEASAKEAYNLVVSDFGTYFVGNRRLLVHDNTPMAEPTRRLPGLATTVQTVSD